VPGDNDLIPAERRHAKALKMRLDWLDQRQARDTEPHTYDRAEMAALRIALSLFDLHFVTQTAAELTTSSLLREGAEAVDAAGQHALAARLHERAKLLEEQ
jgi:hypothetical protein